MAAINRPKTSNGYGEKIQVTVVTVDKEKYRVECATRDGAMIFVAVWETSTVFRWPEVGEKWTVRKDMGIWRLDQIVQTELMEVESEATPKTLEELPEGDTRIIGETVHMANASIANATLAGLNMPINSMLPTEAEPGDIILFSPEAGILWNLVYTGTSGGIAPWYKIGGNPIYRAGIGGASETTASITTGCPSYTLPFNMEFVYSMGASYIQLNTEGLNEGQLWLSFLGTEYNNVVRLTAAGIDDLVTPYLSVPLGTALHKGTSCYMHYNVTIAGRTMTFADPYFTIDPIRVG